METTENGKMPSSHFNGPALTQLCIRSANPVGERQRPGALSANTDRTGSLDSSASPQPARRPSCNAVSELDSWMEAPPFTGASHEGKRRMPGLRGLRDQRVIVTGAAGAIGRAIVERLAEEGGIVGVLDLDGEGAEAVVGALRETGGRAHALAADLTRPEQVEQAVERFVAKVGSVDGLVNNAGWDVAHDFLDTDEAVWQKLVDINLMGPLRITKAVLTHMAAQRCGRVVSIASDAGRVGSSGEAVYAACKGGIIAFSKSVARELARQGVTFNAVCPGPTDTPLLEGLDPTGRLQQALVRAIPMRRLGEPTDLPGIVAFLLSDDAAFITGQSISVSGGLTMHG